MSPIKTHDHDTAHQWETGPKTRLTGSTSRQDAKSSIPPNNRYAKTPRGADTAPMFGFQTSNGSDSEAQRYGTNMPSMSQSTQDSLSPMERFAILGPANYPFPWETRRVIHKLGLREGSSPNLNVRLHNAAIAAVGTSSKESDSISVVAVAGSI